MTISFFPSSLVLDIPKGIFLIGLVGIFIAGLVEFRQGHIGRPAIFANALLLWQIFFSVWSTLPLWLNWYLNIGSIVGMIAIISYIPRHHLPTEFYKFCFILYGSLSILLVIGFSIYLKIPLF